MTDPIGHSARAAAQHLAAEYGTGLPADMEAALRTREPSPRPEQYLDPISLAGLIVSIATLAWTIYNDLRTKTPEPSPAVVARTIRVQLGDVGELGSAQRDRIIELSPRKLSGPHSSRSDTKGAFNAANPRSSLWGDRSSHTKHFFPARCRSARNCQ